MCRVRLKSAHSAGTKPAEVSGRTGRSLGDELLSNLTTVRSLSYIYRALNNQGAVPVDHVSFMIACGNPGRTNRG